MTLSTNLGMNIPIDGASNDVWGAELVTILNMFDSQFAGTISGLTLSAAGSTATFGIASGIASGMLLATAYTKTTSAWGVGTGQGALDTGSIANNTWYHAWLVQRSDTLVVDVLVSLSATAPTMPANYDRKRRIGSMKTDGSAQWIKFSQFGDRFLWSVPVNDISSVTPGVTTAVTPTLTVPTGIQVDALFAVKALYAATAGTFLITSPDQADTAPSSAQYSGILTNAVVANVIPSNVRTNTSGQVRIRFSAIDMVYDVMTRGWDDRRGQN